MVTTTRRPADTFKSKSTEAGKATPAKTVSGKAALTKIRSARPTSAKAASPEAAAHILPAAKGPRTISHRKMKEAVDKVFRERSHARG